MGQSEPVADDATRAAHAPVTALLETTQSTRHLSPKLKAVARDGALEALTPSRLGRRGKQHDIEMEEARAEAERLQTAAAVQRTRCNSPTWVDSFTFSARMR